MYRKAQYSDHYCLTSSYFRIFFILNDVDIASFADDKVPC